MELFILTLDTLGALMIAYAALNVHHRFHQEHKISEKVYSAMHIENRIGVLGIIFIVAAYLLEAILILN